MEKQRIIRTREDLEEYLKCDKKQLGITRKFPRPFTDEIWKYEITLRKYEYWINQKTAISKIMELLYKIRFHKWCVKTGIFIGPNTCGKGLSIAHIGTIQINGCAKIGENLRIHEGVTIGASGGDAPMLGNNIFLGSGCKVIGDIFIADKCAVGANAVVVKDIEEEGISVAGVPAKKISNKNSDKYIYFYQKDVNS